MNIRHRKDAVISISDKKGRTLRAPLLFSRLSGTILRKTVVNLHSFIDTRKINDLL